MKNRFLHYNPFLLIAILITISDLSAQCDAILNHGIYDYESTNSYRDKSLALVNWYKNQKIQTLQEAKNASGNASFPIEGILVGMGFSYDETGFQQFTTFIEQYEYRSETDKLKFEQVVKTINPTIVTAWKDCISQPGLHVWVEFSNNEYEFILCSKYIPDGPLNEKAYLKSIEFGSGSVTTSGSILYNNGKPTTSEITGATLRQIFIRKTRKPFTIVVSGNRGRGLNFSFTEIVIPKPIENKSGYIIMRHDSDELKNQEIKVRVNGSDVVYVLERKKHYLPIPCNINETIAVWECPTGQRCHWEGDKGEFPVQAGNKYKVGDKNEKNGELTIGKD